MPKTKIKRAVKKISKKASSRPKATKKITSTPVVQVAHKTISHNHPTFIIAEIGINHNGNVEIAKKLIDAAVDAGVDAVKFQKRTVPVVYSAEELAKPRTVDRSILQAAIDRGALAQEAMERLKASDFQDATNGDLKYALEFGEKEFKEIDLYARAKNILWFASCWDEDAVDFIDAFNPPVYKIASPSLTDKDLLKHTRSKGKPIILSTGMSDMPLIEKAIKTLGTKDLVVLHCVMNYPAPEHELNLRAIHTLRDAFGLPTGYSGHESSLSPSLAAAVLGACVIERHITLDHSMPGSDHAASIEPAGFKNLVDMIRKWEVTKGTGEKKILESEIPTMKKLRRKHTL